jgi:hypothetical protein
LTGVVSLTSARRVLGPRSQGCRALCRPDSGAWVLTRPDVAILVLVFRILYGFITSLAQLAVRSRRSKDLQINVLRHENSVLRRKIGLACDQR